MPRRPRSGVAAALVFALLVLATVAAFAWSQRVKRDPLILDRVTFVAFPRKHPGAGPVHSFTPNGDCRFDLMRIRFRVTQSDHATVQVVRPGGRVVITLARDRFLKRYHFHTFYWDGRSRDDGTAPPGRYKLRVKLLEQERTLVTPGAIRLHSAPPRRPGSCGAARRGTGTSRPAARRVASLGIHPSDARRGGASR
jgi:hypothetical protein